MGMDVETLRRAQDGNGDESGDGIESSKGGGDGDGDGEKNEDGIGEGREKAKKRKKPHKSCERDIRYEGDLVGERKKT